MVMEASTSGLKKTLSLKHISGRSHVEFLLVVILRLMRFVCWAFWKVFSSPRPLEGRSVSVQGAGYGEKQRLDLTPCYSYNCKSTGFSGHSVVLPHTMEVHKIYRAVILEQAESKKRLLKLAVKTGLLTGRKQDSI